MSTPRFFCDESFQLKQQVTRQNKQAAMKTVFATLQLLPNISQTPITIHISQRDGERRSNLAAASGCECKIHKMNVPPLQAFKCLTLDFIWHFGGSVS
jgi:hypothetical protein